MRRGRASPLLDEPRADPGLEVLPSSTELRPTAQPAAAGPRRTAPQSLCRVGGASARAVAMPLADRKLDSAPGGGGCDGGDGTLLVGVVGDASGGDGAAAAATAATPPGDDGLCRAFGLPEPRPEPLPPLPRPEPPPLTDTRIESINRVANRERPVREPNDDPPSTGMRSGVSGADGGDVGPQPPGSNAVGVSCSVGLRGRAAASSPPRAGEFGPLPPETDTVRRRGDGAPCRAGGRLGTGEPGACSTPAVRNTNRPGLLQSWGQHGT
eukprot:364331-Chlamydomonas_euryale.AAC.8